MLHRVTLLCFALIITSGVALQAQAQSEKEIDQAVEALSQDRALRQLHDRAFEVVEAVYAGLEKMLARERNRLIKDLRSFVERRGSPESEQGQKLMKQLQQISGVTEKDLRELGRLGQGLRERHPIVKSGPAATGQADYKVNGMEYRLRSINPDESCEAEHGEAICACIDACYEEARVAANQAGYEWAWDMITSFPSIDSFLGFFILWIDVHEIHEEQIDCLKACDVDGSVYGEDFDCQSDADCEADEYCHKPIGNPVNSCYPKKELGMPCSGDRKCESGCCKYHLFTNPLQMVCRPSDKCN